MCTEEGRLQKLMLGGAGLVCAGGFPAAVGRFEALHTLELEVAKFGQDTAANAAKVRAQGGERRGAMAGGAARTVRAPSAPAAAAAAAAADARRAAAAATLKPHRCPPSALRPCAPAPLRRCWRR
jgi:hypothetical protein